MTRLKDEPGRPWPGFSVVLLKTDSPLVYNHAKEELEPSEKNHVSSQAETCHRIGGGSATNLKLRPAEERLQPPGISVLIGGAPEQAAADFRRVFGSHSSLGKRATVVGTASIQAIRAAGFDVIEDPSSHFPNHGRLIHSTHSAQGFSGTNLDDLACAFSNKVGL